MLAVACLLVRVKLKPSCYLARPLFDYTHILNSFYSTLRFGLFNSLNQLTNQSRRMLNIPLRLVRPVFLSLFTRIVACSRIQVYSFSGHQSFSVVQPDSGQDLFKADKAYKVLDISATRFHTIGRKLIIGITHGDAGEDVLIIWNIGVLSHYGCLHHSLAIDDRSQASFPRRKA